MREGYGSRSVCVCVSACLSITTLTATYTSFASPNFDVIRFLVAFQTHDLCGFRRERFVHWFWSHLLILSFLTSPISAS